MNVSVDEARTVIEAVKKSLESAARYNSGDSVGPAAVIWTDAEGEWRPMARRLRELMPELLTLGSFNAEQRTGPAIWLRCVIDGALDDVRLPPNVTPIVYLPNVSRQLLRSPEECPDELKPLVELQYRGCVWTQANGKDWTVEAFLLSENGGLGLEVARDNKTRSSLLGALDTLATTPIVSLRNHRLEAEDFDKLMVGDVVRDILLWLSDPSKCKAEWDAARWRAFNSRCKESYDLDPERDGEVVAAERLGLHQHSWREVWRRFTESPTLYPGIPGALRRAKPRQLPLDREPWPDENERDEATLRRQLADLEAVQQAAAREVIRSLEESHRVRREWVWARLGQSPLAKALEHLKTLADSTVAPLGGDTPDMMARGYVEGAYRADDAMLRALASVRGTDDQVAVSSAIRALYLGWLDDTARRFQYAVTKSPIPDLHKLKGNLVAAEPGQCLLFVDGLRFDVAQRLVAMAKVRHLNTTEGYRWSAVPTVTPTGKPAVTPVAWAVQGDQAGDDFCPRFTDTDREVETERLRERIAAEGYEILRGVDVGKPSGEGSRGWTEYGEFDELGHKLQVTLAAHIDEQVELLLDRILHLLGAGWRTVRVVTDHGWLLLPGGFPSLNLKKHLTDCRWARCAVIKAGALGDVPTVGWFWNPSESVSYAPGVYCFKNGTEYTHGGLSLQECLNPDLVFSMPGAGEALSVTIESVQWLGLRCRVTIKPSLSGLSACLRDRAADPQTNICAAKSFDSEGRAGLLVEKEELAGCATTLVVVDGNGRVICKQATMVGGES